MNKTLGQVLLLFFLLFFAASCTAAPTATESIPEQPSPTWSASATNPVPTQTVTPTLEAVTETIPTNTESVETNIMIIKIGDSELTATLVDNSSTDALKEALSEGPLTIAMRDYGSMEKVGSFGMSLPRNDEQITTEAGDLILYQGDMFVIYYAPNSWNFTRLGKINDVTAEELRALLGSGDVTVTLSLP
jgi:hypothetical protein